MAPVSAGWPEIAHHTIDATNVGEVPIRNHKPAMVVYVVSYMFVCSYFMMNTFVGVVCVVPAAPRRAAPRRQHRGADAELARACQLEPTPQCASPWRHRGLLEARSPARAATRTFSACATSTRASRA